MNQRTTVRLPEELLDRAKRKADAEGRTVTSLIEEGLRVVLSETSRSANLKRTLPPISKARGGLLPGIDMTDSAMLQELDDLDAARRMKRFT
ncbi:MAG: hypothetical protein JO163_06175 [Methylobacteriaceae bacterium]|nr:hypothetical protein [Methylobacteriaceae bacterium]MBV9702294.1 hypothetical protein [Methylobacteriaceae bacterium]